MGGFLLLAPSLAAVIPMLSGLGTAFMTSGASAAIMGEGMWLAAAGAGGLGTALTGLAVLTGVGLALVAVTLVITAAAKAMKDAKEKAAAYKKVVDDVSVSIAQSSDSYEEYTRRIDDFAERNNYLIRTTEGAVDATGKLIFTTAQLTRTHRYARLEMDKYGGIIDQQTKSYWEMIQMGPELQELHENFAYEMKGLRGEIEETIPTLEALAAAEKEAARIAEEEFGAAMRDLAYIMRDDLGKEQEAFHDRNVDLFTQLGDVNSAIEELEGRSWLNSRQKAELASLHDEQRETRDQIEEVREAHNLATKSILLDLITQRLAMSDIPYSEQAELISTIANEWGLLSDSAVSSMAVIDKLIDQGITDANAYTEALAADVVKNLRINISGGWRGGPVRVPTYSTEPEGWGGGGTGGQVTGGGWGTQTGPGWTVGGQPGERGQHGGRWSGRDAIAVGEIGEEWIIPVNGGYMIMTAAQVREAKSAGARAGMGLYTGGIMIDGLVGVGGAVGSSGAGAAGGYTPEPAPSPYRPSETPARRRGRRATEAVAPETQAASTAAVAATTAAVTMAATTAAVVDAVSVMEDSVDQQRLVAQEQIREERAGTDRMVEELRAIREAIQRGGTMEDQVEGFQDAVTLLDLG